VQRRLDRAGLVRRFLEGKSVAERFVVVRLERETVALAGGALRIQMEELGGGIAHLPGGAALRLFPLAAAQGRQRHLIRGGAGIAPDEVQLVTGT
jgi:hypothetical protein